LSDHFREGNVFLVGDAAHLFSPIGGLGMNTGIQDAYNLAWKLAGTIHNKYPENFLNSYELERQHMAENLIDAIDKSTKIITRQDCDINGALKNWLPTLSNRYHLRHVWPTHYSGLGQFYNTKNNNKIIHIPYAKAFDLNGKVVSSYDLVRDYEMILLFFVEKENFDMEKFDELLNVIGNVCVITKFKVINHYSSFQYLLDYANEFYEAFHAKEGDVSVLRPDGYMYEIFNVKNIGSIKSILNY
jgi:hypothetical protein